MIRRKPPAELGRLVDVHRPLHPATGWGFLALLTLPFPVFAAVSAPGPLIGLAMLVAFGLVWTYGFGEIVLLEHRLHEHGIVFRSAVPGTPIYVVPHATVHPDSLTVGRRHKPGGGVETPDRRFRQYPLVPTTVDLLGLHPADARRLGKGRLGWDDAVGRPPRPVTQWSATYRDPEQHRASIRDTVHRSQQTQPYNRRPLPPTTGS